MLAQKLFGAAAAAPADWSLYAVVGGNDTTSVTLPTGLQSGDVGVLFDTCVQTATISSVIPTGWTQLYAVQETANTLRHRTNISRRILNSSLSGTAVSGIPASAGSVGKMLLVIRPTFTATTISIGTVNSGVTLPASQSGALPAAQTVTSAAATLNLRFGYWRTTNGVDITGNGTVPSVPYFYDLQTQFGGTVVGVGSWNLGFDANPGASVPSTVVNFGSVPANTSYAVLVSGSIAIS